MIGKLSTILSLFSIIFISNCQYDFDEENVGITRGKLAKPGQFPYQALIMLTLEDDEEFVCGGSILSERWILTAAHCFNTNPSIEIIVGTTKISNPEKGAQRFTANLSEDIIIHESYNKSFYNFDLALIKLSSDMKFNKNVSPIRLPRNFSETYNDVKAVASGWGLTSDKDHVVSDSLNFVELKVISNQLCLLQYGHDVVIPTTLCVSGEGGRQICSGDSGGPLVYNNTLIGVTSFGYMKNCEDGSPGGFSRITMFLKWIEDKTGLK